MPTDWPADEFRKLLRDLMDAAEIPDYAELSRLSGVSQTQLSHWNRGKAQPGRESLAKIAKVLQVSPVRLWLASGLASADELNLEETPDLRVLPVEFREQADLYEDLRLTEDQRTFLRRSAAAATAAVRAELVAATKRGRPTGRRRAS